MRFYVDVKQVGNRLFVREVVDGKSVDRKIGFSPKLYTPSQKVTPFKTIYGEYLDEHHFQDMKSANEFVRRYESIHNYKIYGNSNFQYDWISENYPNTVEFDFSQLRVLTIDIETATENGFPNIDAANEEILLITVQDFNTKEIFTFGSRPFLPTHLDKIRYKDKYTYIECKDEKDLLETFLRGWSSDYPHIVTGWNTKFFDMPYLVHRITRVLGEEFAKLLSPWRMMRDKDIEINGKINRTYDIYGIAHVDYLDAYKKYGFTDKAPEDHKLDTIGEVELGRNKLKNPYDTFKEFYTKDWDLFVVYNVNDTDIIDELEDNKKLLFLIVTLAMEAKVNINDSFSPVRMWESVIRNHMLPQGVILPMGHETHEQTIEGAYVKEVKPAAYDWVISFDAASLYPSIMMGWNMSPDTLVNHAIPNVNVNRLLAKEIDTGYLQEHDFCMTANGHMFTRDKQGIVPIVTREIFDKRKIYKKKMLESKQKYIDTKDPQYKIESNIFNVRQMAAKVLANSLYGALSNQYFFLLDYRIAEGITLTGQYIIRTTEKALNTYLNTLLKTENVDYVIAIDTDSCYITLSPLVQKYWPNATKESIVNALDTVCKEKLTKAINAACSELAEYTNAFERTIEFKREVIADRGLWTAKKRYALNVYDSEGVRYAEPELKVMGLEIVRSTTPAVVRKHLKEAVRIALTGTEADLHQFVNAVEEELMHLPPERIAFPKGCNNLAKYYSNSSIYQKGCPIHVRGALLFNHWVQKRGVGNKYQEIGEGDKVKFLYLKMPNPIGENVISFGSELPKEFDLHKYVNYPMMFDKVFIDPLQKILDAQRWSPRPVASLDDLF